MIKSSGVLLTAWCVVSCASLPDATIQYYNPTTKVDVTVNRTVACSDADFPSIVHSIKLSPKYFADTGIGPEKISLEHLKSFGSDGSADFEFYEDGRLKSVSTETEGKGQSIVESGLKIATAFGVFSGSANANACNFINDNTAKRSKAKTVTYEGSADFAKIKSGQTVTLTPTDETSTIASNISAFLVPIEIKFQNGTPIKRVVDSKKTPKSNGVLALREASTYTAEVTAGGNPIWTDKVIVAGDFGASRRYAVPIPEAAFFGSTSFSISLTEAGLLTKVSYGSTGGESGVSSVLAGFADEIGEKASDKDEADEIYQAQRLAICKANKDECPRQ